MYWVLALIGVMTAFVYFTWFNQPAAVKHPSTFKEPDRSAPDFKQESKEDAAAVSQPPAFSFSSDEEIPPQEKPAKQQQQALSAGPRDEEKQSAKPAPGGVQTIVFNIPRSCHPEVANAKKEIEKKYSVKIELHADDAGVEITGTGGAISDAEAKLARVLNFAISTEPLTVFLLDVPREKHGALIGKKHAGQNELEAKGGCNLEFKANGQILIEGTALMVEKMKHVLADRMAEIEIEDAQKEQERARQEADRQAAQRAAEERAAAEKRSKMEAAERAKAEAAAAAAQAEAEKQQKEAERQARLAEERLKKAAADQAKREAAKAEREEQERLAEEAKKATPTPDELADIAKACARLWELDVNRLTPYKEYEIDVQHGKKPYQQGDSAERPLFKRVDESVLQRPTFARFYALLDNYERAVGVAEVVDDNEIYENKAFIQSCLQTPVMLYTHKYLVSKGKADKNLDRFASELYVLWFQLYRRVANNDSSGFEHVFIGEEKNGEVMGMHNWIQLWNEERNNRLDYKGFIFPRDRGNAWQGDPNLDQLITMQFAWMDQTKPVSTSFIGTSPEFELAIYTLCFLAGQEKNPCKLGANRCIITCYHNGSGRNERLGSSFPEEP